MRQSRYGIRHNLRLQFQPVGIRGKGSRHHTFDVRRKIHTAPDIRSGLTWLFSPRLLYCKHLAKL
jgi:hypothetical protein